MGRGIALILTVVACAAALTACTDPDPRSPTGLLAGPTATSTAAPPEAAALADRYRQAGGDADVYGIEPNFKREGYPPHIVVHTRNPDTGNALFQKQAASITSFLTGKEGLTLGGGYTMDVYGPDGRLLHRWDATI
ncbi:hypothetical protein [Streptomyces sp. NPDC096339]|uniref:hypothetical protein n=1 Tax=Streptomyces sp. NPDC096339 TaxID=3366086 RepID=UPI0037FD11A3